jgi:pimeloyl-ACP methyl ester carboxylesterase
MHRRRRRESPRVRIGRVTAVLLLGLAPMIPATGAAQGAREGEFPAGDGVRIHYLVRGAGPPVLLVHGFAVSAGINWAAPGILDSIAARYTVIAPDLRGHGSSGKPREPAAYGTRFVEDLVRLLDHLEVERAHVVGYSMGGAITLRLLASHPHRVASAVIGGAGWRPVEAGPPPVLLEWLPRLDAAARGELTVSDALAGPVGADWAPELRAALDRNDPAALAAVIRGGAGLAVSEAELRASRLPVLAIVGALDELVRADVDRLAALWPDLEVVRIPGADHFSVLGDPRLPQAILRYLAAEPADAAR